MGQAVGEGRAVIEDELVVLRALVDRGLEGGVGLPEGQNLLIHLRQLGGSGRFFKARLRRGGSVGHVHPRQGAPRRARVS